jgi:IS1 family transposase
MRAFFRTNGHMMSHLLALGSAVWLTGCAEVQMGYNVLTYDNAIAETGNQLLLLNAVRASQRYPKSFTNVGQVQAGPQVTGSLPSSFNFASLTGLTTYGFTPSLSATPGYAQFALENANSKDVMEKLRGPVPDKITKSFYDRTNWPRELLDLVYVQGINPTPLLVQTVDFERKRTCAYPHFEREKKRCDELRTKIAEFSSNCTRHFEDFDVRMRELREDPQYYYNTAINYCHYTRFQIFVRELRLIRRPPCQTEKPVERCVPVLRRSALQMIDYLGELIAAQNYIDAPFEPKVLYGYSTERGGPEYLEVPLFVVRRGLGREKAAVSIAHDGVVYYIPQPDFGSPYEARSLQMLDLVLQTVRAATIQDQKDVPKVPTIGIVKQ